MCVDIPDAASQDSVPLLQSDHIALRLDFSGVVRVRVALPHRESRERHHVIVVVVHGSYISAECVSSSARPLSAAVVVGLSHVR
jgi:hypothetical protein